jgi:phage terminase large subunit-like protein
MDLQLSKERRQNNLPSYHPTNNVWWSFSREPNFGEQLEQGKGRVFEICCRIIKASPLLRDEAEILADVIRFPAFNATIRVLPCDAGSAAGSNAGCCGYDELWAVDNESGRRLWDETTPPPTRKIAVRVTTTYAGYSGQSVLLEELYRRGLQLPLIGEDLYGGDGLLMYWTHQPVASWQDEDWEKSMRRERASAYQREFLNEFASSSSQFIDMGKWDRCTDADATPLLSAPHLPVFVAVDGSVKHDATAIAVVYYDEAYKLVRLVFHRIFQPTPEQPLDFEATVEKTLIELGRKYYVKKIVYDPNQLQATMQRMIRAGLPCEEFVQSVPKLTQAAQNLFDLIEAQSLSVYPDAEMRLAVSRCVAVESPRGWRIGKDRQAFKIDVVIALMMACQACIAGQGESNFDTSWRWVDGNYRDAPETKQTEAQAESDSNFRWRLNNYFNAIGMPYHWR